MIVKVFKLISLSGIMLVLVSCAIDIDAKGGVKGNGAIQKEKRPVVSHFETIIASEDVRVLVSRAAEFSITVEADENIIGFIKTEIKDRKLHVHTAKNIGRATKTIYVALPKITRLSCSAGAILQTQNLLKGDSLILTTSTGSNLKANVWYKNVVITGKEGSNLNISGRSENANINVSAGSSLKAEDFDVVKCSATVNFGGHVQIKVSEVLRANANTGGIISYIGNPKVDKRKSLSGTVQKY